MSSTISRDLFTKCHNYTLARDLMRAGKYPFFAPLDSSEGDTVTLNGTPLLMIGSNNYLGLTSHPKVRKAARDAIETYGTSCTGSRFLNGTLRLHHDLDRAMADFIGKESAICFSTGYQSNVGAISALVGRGDLVVVDREAHASIIDGTQLSAGTMKRFRHNDVEHLEYVLRDAREFNGVLVVVDGVYSMGGDIAPLPELVEVCRRHGARVMLDDAHGLGVLGRGHGTAAHFGMQDEIDVIMGTFSKSFASLGGVIAGDDVVIHYIQHFARSLIFSASMPPSNVATVLSCVDVIAEEPERVDRLWENVEYMRTGLKALGYDTGNSASPIIPVIIGDNERTLAIWQGLMDRGIYTNPIFAPAVPAGKQMLRTSYMATHTREQLDTALKAFGEVFELACAEESDRSTAPV